MSVPTIRITMVGMEVVNQVVATVAMVKLVLVVAMVRTMVKMELARAMLAITARVRAITRMVKKARDTTTRTIMVGMAKMVARGIVKKMDTRVITSTLDNITLENTTNTIPKTRNIAKMVLPLPRIHRLDQQRGRIAFCPSTDAITSRSKGVTTASFKEHHSFSFSMCSLSLVLTGFSSFPSFPLHEIAFTPIQL